MIDLPLPGTGSSAISITIVTKIGALADQASSRAVGASLVEGNHVRLLKEGLPGSCSCLMPASPAVTLWGP